jgi:hypothetical protein
MCWFAVVLLLEFAPMLIPYHKTGRRDWKHAGGMKEMMKSEVGEKCGKGLAWVYVYSYGYPVGHRR